MNWSSLQGQCNKRLNRGESPESILQWANDKLGFYGIESIYPSEDYGDTWRAIASYANNGHSYQKTIVYDIEYRYFQAISWAEWYERWLTYQDEDKRFWDNFDKLLSLDSRYNGWAKKR